MRRLLCALALGAAVLGCSGGAPDGGDEAGAPFDGEVATVDGGTLAGADYVRRDLALWFWAPW